MLTVCNCWLMLVVQKQSFIFMLKKFVYLTYLLTYIFYEQK